MEEADTAEPDAKDEATLPEMLDLKLFVGMRQVSDFEVDIFYLY